MKNTKNNFYFFAILFAVFVIAFSCKSSQEVAQKTIDDKMTTFFAALEKQDFETAKTLVTPATQKLLDVVIKDAQKYKEFNDKPQTIKVEILDRKIVESVADYKIRIIIGEKVKEQSIHCVYTNEVWYLDMPEEYLSFCRYVVFYDRYESILIIYKKKYAVQETVIYVDRTHKDKTHKKKTHKGKTHKKKTHKR
jgi:hypothetical protein